MDNSDRTSMDPDFPKYFQKQLRYITESFSGEFAAKHPKVAARLGARAGEVRDPYVQRLLQSFAFTAARAEMNIDRMADPFILRQLEAVNQNYVAPLPSMAVVRFYPDLEAAHSPQGHLLPRGTQLTLCKGQDGRTASQFRTSQDVRLWPLRIEFARPAGVPADVPLLHRYVADLSKVRGALRLRFSTINGTPLRELRGLDRLPVYLCGEARLASQLFELIHTSVIGMVMGVPGAFETGELYGMRQPNLPQMGIDYEGLEPQQSMLRPVYPRFHGHMLVHEYFACPPRFWFFALTGLQAGLRQLPGSSVEIILLLSREAATLDQQVDASQFALGCTPAVNLFEASSERLCIDPGQDEHRLVPFVAAPDDFEVHSVNSVEGQFDDESEVVRFEPLDAALPDDTLRDARFFTLRRELHKAADSERRYGTLRDFVRTRLYLRLLARDHQPGNARIRHLTLNAWLTNGNLPCVTPPNGVDDLVVKDAKAVAAVGFVRAPTAPRPPLARGDAAWNLLRQLTLEYGVFDDDFSEPSPGEVLRETLRPYLGAGEASVMARQLDGLIGAAAQPVHAVHRWDGDPQHARGIEVRLTFDEEGFDGGSPFTFALALERYVAAYVSGHSFTRTALCTKQRGLIYTWPTRDGSRQVL